MATTSTAAAIQQLRTRLLTFAPMGGGATLNTRLGGRLYIGRAPDNTPSFPYGVMRLINQRQPGAYNGDKEEADLELMIYGNTVAQAQALEDAADVADQALLRYKDATSGLIFGRERLRDSVSGTGDPVLAAFLAVRCLYPVSIWPIFLTQYAST